MLTTVSVAKKLQVTPGQRIAVLRCPADVALDIDAVAGDPSSADGVVVFAAAAADLDGADGQLAVDAALRDAVAWVAYPKAGQLGTDLNRDKLAALMIARGAQPVRQVAIDDIWSALRFRPAR